MSYAQATGGTYVPATYMTTSSASTMTNVFYFTNTTGNSTQIVQAPQPRAQIELDEVYALPDGSKLHIDRLGNYRIDDSKAKVTYRANRVREFNPYINASDLLEHFINEVGVMDGVNQGEVLRLPIEAFINWLILQAAKRDGDRLEGLPSVESALPAPPALLALPAPTPLRARCETCGRFIRKAWAQARIAFCSPEHMQLRLARLST